MNKFLRWFLIGAGTVALGLGVLGIFLPLLPTTPFLLLAAAAYARSSDRFHDWLLGHRVFGEYIRNYRDHRAIKLQAKVTGITLLWLTIGISVILVGHLWVRLLLLGIAIAVTLHLVSLKTIRS